MKKKKHLVLQKFLWIEINFNMFVEVYSSKSLEPRK